MAHYLAEEQASSDLSTNYPEASLALSLQDYLEAKFSAGWEFVSMCPRGSDTNWMFVFKANAQ